MADFTLTAIPAVVTLAATRPAITTTSTTSIVIPHRAHNGLTMRSAPNR